MTMGSRSTRPRRFRVPVRTLALVIWLSVIAAGAALATLARAILNRVRITGWQHDIDTLLCSGGGQTNTQP